ncbi:hypothetical protein [Streptomyces violascens]|uniref:Lipoprotein n=1 Tax=Streptomyces violascens TaxID=67381 RepID=A0ABQ3QS35_9ACTN|nr:hypothetical protein [Streptomyces violascens]GGU51448.1 hypothetical protein GCM10010289_84770 [Streptomyces violascens]GHI40088.1 hypothetical protein Sviol_44960 [Streptomyces violascens]
MHHHRLAVAAAVLAVAAASTSCSGAKSPSDAKHSPAQSSPAAGTKSPAAGAPAALPEGPGPQSKYTVQAQPPAGSCHVRTAGGQPLPDAKCTPGALNPKVTPATLKETICKSGYTSTIRPPASITGPEKTANAKSYGLTGSPHDAEYDHLVSLELGGDPNDPRNLWVEPPSPGHKPGAGPNNPKDQVESKLHTAICSGKTSLAAAQNAIATDWPNALAKLGLS